MLEIVGMAQAGVHNAPAAMCAYPSQRLRAIFDRAEAAARARGIILNVDLPPPHGRIVTPVEPPLRALGPVARVRGNHEAMLAELIAGRAPAASRAVIDRLAAHRDALDDEAPQRLEQVLNAIADEQPITISGRKPVAGQHAVDL